jgi:hypothetical protein
MCKSKEVGRLLKDQSDNARFIATIHSDLNGTYEKQLTFEVNIDRYVLLAETSTRYESSNDHRIPDM